MADSEAQEISQQEYDDFRKKLDILRNEALTKMHEYNKMAEEFSKLSREFYANKNKNN